VKQAECFGGNLIVRGGMGSDEVVVLDVGSQPVQYHLSNGLNNEFGSISGFGQVLGPSVIHDTACESIVINAGGGADTFFVDSFRTGRPQFVTAAQPAASGASACFQRRCVERADQ
jgi:hypothetical protein